MFNNHIMNMQYAAIEASVLEKKNLKLIQHKLL